jgi:hypothetical protein
MKVDKITDENGSIINYWRIESQYTPWWMSEISDDPNDKVIKWINVGYNTPLSTEKLNLEYVLAISAMNYSNYRN